MRSLRVAPDAPLAKLVIPAEPVKESTGRIVRYELRPLESLDHPRIDVLVNLSGIFRDSFVNIVELLDDLFRRAAEADEPLERNAIRRHMLQLSKEGIENPSARLFSNPAGDFGSLVNDRVSDANWESSEELADTWQGRNVFSYGRADKGEARPQVLAALLRSTSGWVVNHKRVERIWRQEGLKVMPWQPKRSRIWPGDGACIRLRAKRPNHV